MALATRGTNFCKPDVVRYEWELAKELGINITVHVAMDRFGYTKMQLRGLRDMDLLYPNTTYIHSSHLLEDEWPAKEWGSGMFPVELLREAIPAGDIHTEEERRLLYVAMTRAQEHLLPRPTRAPPKARRSSSQLRDGQATAGGRPGPGGRRAGDGVMPDAAGAPTTGPGARTARGGGRGECARAQVMPPRRATAGSPCGSAPGVLQLIEGIAPDDPEADAARERLVAELASIGREAAGHADEAREAGLDPLTLRVVSLDSGVGANLLQVAPLPDHFSYSQFDTYERCPLRYAFSHVYRIPPLQRGGALAFGSTAHAAFEAFTRKLATASNSR
jgi:hypothetical protein